MKRLTKLNGMCEHELTACFECHPGGKNEKCGMCEHNVLAIDTLGLYEDTGLTPDEVVKLKNKCEKIRNALDKLR